MNPVRWTSIVALVLLTSAPACAKESKARSDDHAVRPVSSGGGAEEATPVAKDPAPTPVVARDPGAAAADPAAADKAPVPAAKDPEVAAKPTARGGDAKVPAGGDAKVPAGGGAAVPQDASSGQNIDRDSYQVKVAVAATYTAGAQGTVEVTLSPKSGWHVNQDFPTKLEVTAPDGVVVAKAKLKKEDAAAFDEHHAVFKVAFTPAAAGAKTFAARFRFVVCNDDSCDPNTEQLAWKVAVK